MGRLGSIVTIATRLRKLRTKLPGSGFATSRSWKAREIVLVGAVVNVDLFVSKQPQISAPFQPSIAEEELGDPPNHAAGVSQVPSTSHTAGLRIRTE